MAAARVKSRKRRLVSSTGTAPIGNAPVDEAPRDQAPTRGTRPTRRGRACQRAPTRIGGARPQPRSTPGIGPHHVVNLRSPQALLRSGERASTGDGAYRDRTGDLRLAKPALSQLS